MEERKVKFVPVGNIIPGMIAANDICNRNNELIVPKDSVIDGAGITRITLFEIPSVTVYADDPLLLQINEQNFQNQFASQEEKEEFIEFRKNYNSTLELVSKELKLLLNEGQEIDYDELVKEVDKLVYKSQSKYHIFNMLHDIKTFSDETFRHTLNVAIINNIFAEWLKMDDEEKKDLTLCGLLHDLGKLFVDPDVLRKPGKLTDDEFQQIKQHPVLGYNCLKSKNIPDSVKQGVLLHHERSDGLGYPYGFKNDEIAPFAAITSIADAYEAMTATRVYRKGLSPFDVIRIFEIDGKKQFNPVYLFPLLKHMTNTYLQHRVVLSNGLTGKVVLINKDELSRPMVMLDDETFLDLSKSRGVQITEVQ